MRKADNAAFRERATFLTDYACWLFGCGATCTRMEKNVARMAEVFGMHVEIYIMPRHLHLAISDLSGSDTSTFIVTPRPTPINFTVNTQLSRLSWDVADGKYTFEQACDEFFRIITPHPERRLPLLLIVALANASFCRLFGGDAVAMLVVGVATLAGFWLKGELLSRRLDFRIVTFLCALVSSILGSTAILFDLGETAYVALATSVLYLVPGIPFLNSFSDFLGRHYICALSRFTDAVVMTCCLSAGLCVGMMLMKVGMF